MADPRQTGPDTAGDSAAPHPAETRASDGAGGAGAPRAADDTIAPRSAVDPIGPRSAVDPTAPRSAATTEPYDPDTGERGTTAPRSAHPMGSQQPAAIVPPSAEPGRWRGLALAGAAVLAVILLVLLIA